MTCDWLSRWPKGPRFHRDHLFNASFVIIGTRERFRLARRSGAVCPRGGGLDRVAVRARRDSFGRGGLELAGPVRVTSLRKPTTPFNFGIGLLGAVLALGPPLAWAQNPPPTPIPDNQTVDTQTHPAPELNGAGKYVVVGDRDRFGAGAQAAAAVD